MWLRKRFAASALISIGLSTSGTAALEVALSGKVCAGSEPRIERAEGRSCDTPVGGARIVGLEKGETRHLAISADDGSFSIGPMRIDASTDCLKFKADGRAGWMVCGASAARSAGLSDGRFEVIVRLKETAAPPASADVEGRNPWSIGGEPLLRFLQERIDRFEATTLDGRRLTIPELRGRVVLLEFWATTCGPCKRKMPGQAALYRRMGEAGLEIVGICRNAPDPEVLRTWLERVDAPWLHVAEDPEVEPRPSTLFQIQVVPSSIVLDRDGRVIAAGIGQSMLETLEGALSSP